MLRYMDHDARKDPLESDVGKTVELFSILELFGYFKGGTL